MILFLHCIFTFFFFFNLHACIYIGMQNMCVCVYICVQRDVCVCTLITYSGCIAMLCKLKFTACCISTVRNSS